MPQSFLRTRARFGQFLFLVFLAFQPSIGEAALPYYVPPEVLPYLADVRFHIPNDGEISTIDLINGQLGNGKRLRPLLCYLGAGMLGMGPEKVESLACAAEWAHNASLFHDDVLDDSETRRGKPTLWKLTDVKGAVLLGDKLLAALTRKVMKNGGIAAADSILEVIDKMTEGEFLQRKIIEEGSFRRADWDQIALFKTGLLFSWSLAAPAVVSESPEAVIRNFQSIGEDLGRMFQLRDDIEDSFSPDELGQINLVFLRSSELSGASALRPDLQSGDVVSARGWAKNHLRVEIASLKDRLGQLAQIITRGKEPAKSAESYPARCVRSLTEIFGAIAEH